MVTVADVAQADINMAALLLEEAKSKTKGTEMASRPEAGRAARRRRDRFLGSIECSVLWKLSFVAPGHHICTIVNSVMANAMLLWAH